MLILNASSGITLTHGTTDAPTPQGEITAAETTSVSLNATVQPAATGQEVELRYCLNGGRVKTINTGQPREERGVNYFQVQLEGLKAGDEVQYHFVAIVNGEEIPPAAEQYFGSSFKIVGEQQLEVAEMERIFEKLEKEEEIPAATEQPQPERRRGLLRLRREKAKDTNKLKPNERVVWGYVTNEYNKPATDATVRAYEKDLRSETFLGEAQIKDTTGIYRILYTDEQYQAAEAKKADLIVRAFDVEGNLRVTSQLDFNVPQVYRVDLQFEAVKPEEPKPSGKETEYERLITVLTPLMEGVGFADMTDDDIDFLANETGIPALYLQFLKNSFELGQDNDLLKPGCYGWHRQGLSFSNLTELFRFPVTRLLSELKEAIAKSIIPALDLDEIGELLRTLQFETGILVNQTFWGQLIDSETKFPIDDFTVVATDAQAENIADRELGETITDSRGMFSFTCPMPADATEDFEKPVQLTIKDENGAIALETAVMVKTPQDEVLRIEISLDALSDTSKEIDNNLAPGGLLRRFNDEGIKTIADVLRNPDKIDALEAEFPDNAELKNIISHASWSIIEDDHDKRQILIDAGYPSIYDVTETSRAHFVTKMHDKLGDVGATELYLQAEVANWTVANAVTNFRLRQANGDEDSGWEYHPEAAKKQVEHFPPKCTCKDCESGVSPLAYLADLERYIVKNIKRNGDALDDISIPHLEEIFFQDFGSLPANCESMNKKYRQVRICIDALRRFRLSKNVKNASAGIQDDVFSIALQSYHENAYKFLLTQLGVSYEELRLAQPTGNAFTPEELNDPGRQRLAQRLGIATEHLTDLMIPLVTNSLIARLFNIFGYFRVTDANPYEENESPAYLEWQLHQLRNQWEAQDRPFSPYDAERSIPIIDPTIITSDYFRDPNPGNDAFDIYQFRLDELNDFSTQIFGEFGTLGVETVISRELGNTPFDTLVEWFDNISSTENAAQALNNLASISIPVEHFIRLMVLATRPGAAGAGLEEMADILTYIQKHRLYPRWVEDEKHIESGATHPSIVFGAATFVLPINNTAPTQWLATEEDQALWRQAYQNYNSLPLIDPDQLTSEDFNHDIMLADNPAYDLWMDRHLWREDRAAELHAVIDDTAPDEQNFNNIFAASNIGTTPEEITILNNRLRRGEDIRRRLAQLGLDMAMFRFILHLQEVITSGFEAQPEQWDGLINILLQIEKSRVNALWKIEEQAAGIVLSDEYFVLNTNLTVTPSDNTVWLRNIPAYIEWQRTLDARIEQKRTFKNALQEAISQTEERHLPALRDAYIQHLRRLLPGKNVTAEWLEARLLINMQISGCQMTTRVSETITTLQQFVWGIYINTLNNAKVEDGTSAFDYIITSDYFEDEWKWLKSYADWKSAMFVYLFPENTCIPQLQKPEFQSYGFRRLLRKLQLNFTPGDACELIKEYGEYFDDVRKLRVQAVCYADTFSDKPGDCYQPKNKSKHIFLFALAEETGRVYWCKFKDRLPYDNLIWNPVGPFSNNFVTEIIAATPFPTDETHIALFAKIRETDSLQLNVVFHNVETGNWGGEKRLSLPPGANEGFQVTAAQKNGNFNLLLPFAFLVHDGRVYLRNFSLNNRAWDLDKWELHYWGHKDWEIKKIGVLIELRSTYNVLISEFKNNQIKFRVPSQMDCQWFDVGEGVLINAVVRKSSHDSIIVYYHKSPSDNASHTEYKIIEGIDKHYDNDELTNINNERVVFSEFSHFDDWARNAAGISTKDIELEFSYTRQDFSMPESNSNYESFKGWQNYLVRKDQIYYFEGHTLKDLIETKEEEIIGSLFYSDSRTRYPELIENYSSEILEQYLSFGFKKLEEIITDTAIDDGGGSSNMLKIILLNEYIKKYCLKHPVYPDEELIGTGTANAIKTTIKASINEYEIADENLPGVLSSILEGKKILKLLNRSILDGNVQKEKEYANDDQINLRFGFRFPDSILISHTGYFQSQKIKLPYSFSIQRNKNLSIIVENNLKECWIADNYSNSLTFKIVFRYRINFYYDGYDYLELMKPKPTLDYDEKKMGVFNYYIAAQESSLSNLRFMQEAFRGVPEQIALQLQRNGYYEEALDFFKNIYDFTKPIGQRKIDYWLIYESTNDFEINYTRKDSWWRDPLNPHEVASNRKSSYTRHILILITRCLIEYADSEFSRDNVEANARARKLYELALDLLRTPELNYNSSLCNYLDDLNIEVESHFMQYMFSQINDQVQLREVVNTINQTNMSNLSNIEKFNLVKTVIKGSMPEHQEPMTIAQVVSRNKVDYSKLGRLWNANTTLSRGNIKISKASSDRFLNNLSQSINLPIDELKKTETIVAPLRASRKKGRVDNVDTMISLAPPVNPGENTPKDGMDIASKTVKGSDGGNAHFLGEISFQFCIPKNPVLKTLYDTATNNLFKLNNCLNIAGMKRDLEPYAAPTGSTTGMPFLGAGGQLVIPGKIYINQKPTIYRYTVLIERAKQLAQMANQVEQAMFSALINRDSEEYTMLRARQELELATAGVQLQNLRVIEAEGGVGLAQFQKGQSEMRMGHFDGLISQGLLDNERKSLEQMIRSKDLRIAAQAAFESATLFESGGGILKSIITLGINTQQSLADIANATGRAFGAAAEAFTAESSILATKASHERKEEDWRFQQNLAEWDIKIGDQQIMLAQQRVGIVQQEKVIAELQLSHASEVIQFLSNKFTNADLFDWMSKVLQDVYLYFLQQATAMARLAESQAAFERQEYPPAIIQSDYRSLPLQQNSGSNNDKNGLTGSFRLQRDITELDQYVFLNDRRKQLSVKTFSLDTQYSIEFQKLREDGVITFTLSQEMFDWDFPGQYLRLIKRIRVSVIALIPPTAGVKATLTSSGISRTVTKGDTFQTTIIRRDPEVLVLSGSPIDNTGFFELQPESTMYLPFENSGNEISLEFRMSKASNHFNFDSLADVLITVEYNSLYDFNYRQQVTQQLGREFSAERTISFRLELPDQWYDLHHPEYSDNPMRVSWRTRPSDFPPNLSALRIQHLVMYFVMPDDAAHIDVTHCHFTPDGGIIAVGGAARTNENKFISTRLGNGSSWIPITGQAPFGTWELNLSLLVGDEVNNAAEMELRRRFREGEIEDILFVVTYEGILPAW